MNTLDNPARQAEYAHSVLLDQYTGDIDLAEIQARQELNSYAELVNWIDAHELLAEIGKLLDRKVPFNHETVRILFDQNYQEGVDCRVAAWVASRG